MYRSLLLMCNVGTGLTVTERNYLEVFPYDKWSDKELPRFEQGERFMPSVCELKEGQTTRPSLLTEADLVSLMDKNGIGTTPPSFIASFLALCFACADQADAVWVQVRTRRSHSTYRRSSTGSM